MEGGGGGGKSRGPAGRGLTHFPQQKEEGLLQFLTARIW